MKKTITALFLLLTVIASSQTKYKLSGVVTNSFNTSETLIRANILYGETQGVVTDYDGHYSIMLAPGTYTLIFSYVGFDKLEKTIQIVDQDVVFDAELNPIEMQEVRVVADIARARETPVAFSTIKPKQLQENLAAQDIPLVLNSTPGVYATQEGGGDGDASVTIRGFSARNVGVLLDGVPVNDMETGQVYWSNWFGLDAVTRSIQVQRGLGASKLALPSVGGTINILTSGIETKKAAQVKQEVGSDGYLRSSFGYNSGLLKNNWAISLAGSYKRGNGWVDQTWSEGFFYYIKVDKRLGAHTLSFSAYGAPQKHGQRSYQLPLAVYDSAYAEEQGIRLAYTPDMSDEKKEEVNTNRTIADEGIGQGLQYNQHWGYLARTLNDPNAKSEVFNERINHYHKPQITLKDFWAIKDNLYLSNIAYMSIGRGGGIRAKNALSPNEDGLMDFQSVYDRNIGQYTINTLYDDTQHAATNFMRNLVNEHMWYGLLSTLNYKTNRWSFSGGVDLRSYTGTHYEEIYDLLGADYYGSTPSDAQLEQVDWTSPNPYRSFMLGEGDIINFHTKGVVHWGGLFLQSEYKTDKISAFANITGALSRYKEYNYFYGISSSIVTDETDWNNFPGFTAKGGANYNINDNMNAFLNLGLLNKAPRFNDVYGYDSELLSDIKNEIIKAIEIGYSFNSRYFSANLNAYYTNWNNRPADNSSKIFNDITQEEYTVKINSMNAIHQGIELDYVIKLNDELDFQGIVSLGDWRWNSEDTFKVYNDNRELIKKQYFNNKGVHVGNAAQTQFVGELRWEPIKYLYFKPRVTYFSDYYAQFDPVTLDGSPSSYEWYDEETGEHGDPKDSWKIPAYALFDIHMGYGMKFGNNFLNIRFNILNALNKTYIASAQNNDAYNGQTYNAFDAKSASVFMGMGRRFNLSVEYKF